MKFYFEYEDKIYRVQRLNGKAFDCSRCAISSRGDDGVRHMGCKELHEQMSDFCSHMKDVCGYAIRFDEVTE